jgi:hypothetical protein
LQHYSAAVQRFTIRRAGAATHAQGRGQGRRVRGQWQGATLLDEVYVKKSHVVGWLLKQPIGKGKNGLYIM